MSLPHKNIMRKVVLACTASIAACAILTAAEFWDKKEFSEWNEKQVRKVLFDSPWSRQVHVAVRGEGAFSGVAGPRVGRPGGPIPDPGSAGGIPSGLPGQDDRGDIGGRFPGDAAGDPNAAGQLVPLVVRWTSALPVKHALVQASKTAKQDADEQQADEESQEFLNREETHYVIAVVGLPEEIGASLDEEELRKGARIDRGKEGPPLQPEKVETRDQDRQVALYFFFPRSEPITLEDKRVEFVLTLPEFTAKREFKLQNMVYRGKLEL